MSTFLHLFIGCVCGMWCAGVVPLHVYTHVHNCLCAEARIDVGCLPQPLSILFLETWSACLWSTLLRVGLWACRLQDSAHLHFSYAGIAGPMALSISLCVLENWTQVPMFASWAPNWYSMEPPPQQSIIFVIYESWWFSGLIFRTRASRT